MRDYLEELLDLLPQEEDFEAENWEIPFPNLLALRTWAAANTSTPSTPPSESMVSTKHFPWKFHSVTESILEHQQPNPAPGQMDTAAEPQTADWIAAEGKHNSLFYGAVQFSPEKKIDSLGQVPLPEWPILLIQTQRLERSTVQSQTLALNRRNRLHTIDLSIPKQSQMEDAFSVMGEPNNTRSQRKFVWSGEKDLTQLVDQTFQRDSRRYDRGFSLY